jgi:hypothetical protein
MLFTKPSHVVMAERQYYIGHSYNSVQIANAALPVEKGPIPYLPVRSNPRRDGGQRAPATGVSSWISSGRDVG